MEVAQFGINLTSEQPEKLMAFYRDVVGLPKRPEMGDGAFAMGAATLFVDGHSETKGSAKEPQRYLLDMFVADLKAEQARLEGQGVKFIRKEGQEPWGGLISTFLDPDGNYVQLLSMPAP